MDARAQLQNSRGDAFSVNPLPLSGKPRAMPASRQELTNCTTERDGCALMGTHADITPQGPTSESVRACACVCTYERVDRATVGGIGFGVDSV
jgi:hypothetical protein